MPNNKGDRKESVIVVSGIQTSVPQKKGKFQTKEMGNISEEESIDPSRRVKGEVTYSDRRPRIGLTSGAASPSQGYKIFTTQNNKEKKGGGKRQKNVKGTRLIVITSHGFNPLVHMIPHLARGS